MTIFVQCNHKNILELRIALKIITPNVLVFQRRKVDSGKVKQVPHVASWGTCLIPQIYFAEALQPKPKSSNVQTTAPSGMWSP